MPMQRLGAAVSPLLALIEWVFSPLAPGVDLVLGAWSTAWFGMMVLRPDAFDRGAFTGMQWAPDTAWMVFGGSLVLAHLAGLIHPDWHKLRSGACLMSAWYWICVSVSLTRGGVVPGTWTYGIVGTLALAAAIYVAGRAPRRE